MLTPGQAIASYFRNYAVFAGRAPRSEYWWAALFEALLLLGLQVFRFIPVGSVDASGNQRSLEMISVILTQLILLGLLLPNITLLVRRLHDANFSGYFVFIGFFPVLGGIAIFVFTLLPSNAGGIRFDAPAKLDANLTNPAVFRNQF